MNPYTFHINLYDLAFLGAIFIGLTFTLQLWFTKRSNRNAHRLLGLVLAIVVLQMTWVLGIDIRLGAYFPHWNWLPLQFFLALGPLIYFYILKVTQPQHKFRWKDMLHFTPLLLELSALVLGVKESIRTGAATYDTLILKQLHPALQLLAAISVITYLYGCHRLIEHFYQRQKFNGGDRYRYEFRWLQRLLAAFALLWLLWVPYIAVDYFYYHYQLGIYAYYPLYLVFSGNNDLDCSSSFFKTGCRQAGPTASVFKAAACCRNQAKGYLAEEAVKAGLFYQDPDLNLNSLAEKLELGPHELSRIINTILNKSFNDFINEYRVEDFVQKIQDPMYDHFTLLGIAFESGFKSKTTFNRAFKQVTGKNPVDYKNELKKEAPFYNSGARTVLRR